jgi:hypothetical protein
MINNIFYYIGYVVSWVYNYVKFFFLFLYKIGILFKRFLDRYVVWGEVEEYTVIVYVPPEAPLHTKIKQISKAVSRKVITAKIIFYRV